VNIQESVIQGIKGTTFVKLVVPDHSEASGDGGIKAEALGDRERV